MRIAWLRRTAAKFRWNTELPQKKRRLTAFLMILLVFLVLTAVISEKMRPLVKAMAVSALTDTVQRQVNSAFAGHGGRRTEYGNCHAAKDETAKHGR